MKKEPAEAQRCTCPSGDGSLRWPCPAHPPEAQPAAVQKGYKNGLNAALGIIANLGIADSEAQTNGREDAYRAVEALAAQQPAAVDEAMVRKVAKAINAELEGGDNVVLAWRRLGSNERKLRDRMARAAIAALAAQQPASCPKCGGTGEADSGGIMPWGAPAMILCECQQPAAADEAMVERALAEWKRLEGHQTDAVRMSAALQEALAAQPGGSDND